MKEKYPNPGSIYEHYKGGLYRVLFLSTHTETQEVLVNYQSLHFGSYHTRPLASWNSKTDNGKTRFVETDQEFDV
jgi:hypothetical protein